ncbi:MAG: hypothetical protein K2M41_08000, partial [Muribaculaceae bacterium]|nr:hypothetical protein [Muribaculaceae bacterium]
MWPKKMLPVAVLGEIHDILFPIPDPSSQTHSNISSQITGRTGALRGAGRPFLHVSPTSTPSPPTTPGSPAKSSTTNKNVIKMKNLLNLILLFAGMIVLSNVSTGCSKDEPPVPDPEPPTPVLPTSPEWIDTKFAYVLQVCGYIPDAATVTKEEVAAIDTLIIPLWDSLEPYPDRYLTSLKGIEFFKGLECLKCGINRIEELDLTSNTNLKYLDCDFNRLTTLNLSGLTELQIVICDWNEGLENLNLTDCRKLKTLNAWHNSLTSLDLSTNLALETVDCRGGYLQELKLPEGSQLRKIVAGSFGGESLYVPSSPHLAHLDCGGHNLRHLTVDDPSTITHLDISYSKLDVEILQEFPNLTELHCIDMDWSQLDLRFNTRLESLHCYNSHLRNIDLSNNPLLDYADIHGNNLTQLDLSNN